MHLRRERTADPIAVRARLAPETWPAWLPNARPGADGRVELAFDGPRPFRVAVRVTRTDAGCEIGLIQGELSACQAVVAVSDAGEMVVDVEIAFPVPLPATLMREIEAWFDEVIERLVR